MDSGEIWKLSYEFNLGLFQFIITAAFHIIKILLNFQIFWVAVGLEWGPLSPCESKWGATWKKSSGSGLENWD
jgi:hypothetical protein